MKKKIHKKIQIFFFLNFASIRMPLRCISRPVETNELFTDGGDEHGRLKYIPLQLTGKVYCDRQIQARDMHARVYHKNPLAC